MKPLLLFGCPLIVVGLLALNQPGQAYINGGEKKKPLSAAQYQALRLSQVGSITEQLAREAPAAKRLELFRQRAGLYLADGNAALALADSLEALRIDPRDRATLQLRVAILAAIQEYRQAGAEIDKLVLLEPEKKAFHLAKKAALLQEVSLEEAAQIYGMVLKLDGKYSAGARALESMFGVPASDLLIQGKHDQALALCQRWLQFDDTTLGPVMLRGFIYLDCNRPEPARRDFDEAVRREPKNAWAYYVRALAAPNPDLALADLDCTLRYRLDYPAARWERARLRIQKNQLREAREDLALLLSQPELRSSHEKFLTLEWFADRDGNDRANVPSLCRHLRIQPPQSEVADLNRMLSAP